jgi:hypothetical protein
MWAWSPGCSCRRPTRAWSTRPGSSWTERFGHGTSAGTGRRKSSRARPSRSAPAAAYRAAAFREADGFDETLFAYWEDVDLALRLRLAGWRCVRVQEARAVHAHSATLGASSPVQRRLEAFGRGYLLGRYRVARRRPLTRLKIAILDWPVLLVHLVVRRELGPMRERARGLRAGRSRPALRPPLELANVSFAEALRRQAEILRLRFSGRLPNHFYGDPG